MNILGIEGTAHTLSISLFNTNKGFISNVIDTYPFTPEGFLPRSLADHHSNVFARVLKKALNSFSIKDIDLIAVSIGPGIGAPLNFTVSMAKFLSKYYKIPIVGVNHPLAHIKITEYITGLKDNITIYLSGGNTQILIGKDFKYRVVGETLDIGIGNMFDKFARKAKLNPASGAMIEKLGKKGSYIDLPYYIKGMNFSFSGLLTAAIKQLEEEKIENICYSLMENAFSMVLESAERALHVFKKKSIIITGGVAQNSILKEKLKLLAKENNIKYGVAPNEYNRDNGAMIAYTGYKWFKKFGAHNISTLHAKTKYRIDML